MLDERFLAKPIPADHHFNEDIESSASVLSINNLDFTRAVGRGSVKAAIAEFGAWLEVHGGCEVVNRIVHRRYVSTPFIRIGSGYLVAVCMHYNEMLNVIVVPDGDSVAIKLMPKVLPDYRPFGDWDTYRLMPVLDDIRDCLHKWMK